MNTLFLLMAQYNGLAIIPLNRVCADYFSHLTVEQFQRKVLAGQIQIPIT
ncbi:TPA: pyocin activator PrtN family protein, partial [Pseudomonas aeruginosa]